MNETRWGEIRDKIQEKFGIEEEGRESREGGIEVNWLEFSGPQGKMRLEYVVKPKFLETKTIYSKRAGTHARVVKPVTSAEEKVRFVKAYLWQNEKWQEIKAPL